MFQILKICTKLTVFQKLWIFRLSKNLQINEAHDKGNEQNLWGRNDNNKQLDKKI